MKNKQGEIKRFKALLFSLDSSPVLKNFDTIKEIREELEAKSYAYADVYEYKVTPAAKGAKASGGSWSYYGPIGRRDI